MEEGASNEESSGGDDANLQASKSKCIFCATDCPASFSVIDGQVIRIKEESETNTGGGGSQTECATVERQLRSLFIVQKILNVGGDVCSKFLALGLDPELWLTVCSTCRTDVYQLFKIEKLIKQMERESEGVKNNLKKLICRSGGGGTEEEGDGMLPVSHQIWKEIREKAIEGFTYEEDPDEPSFEDLVTSQNHHDLEEEEEEDDPEQIQSESDTKDETPAPVDLPSVSTRNGSSRKIWYQCEMCNALIHKSNASNLQHETLHLSGDGKTCNEEGCGWLVRSLGSHKRNWHCGKTAAEITADVQIKPLSEYRNLSESESSENEDEPVQPKLVQPKVVQPKSVPVRRPSSPIGQRKVYYQCELCNALISRKVDNINRHLELHRSGNGIKKRCPVKGCGWMVSSLGAHHSIWHCGAAPDNLLIRKLSEYRYKPEKRGRKNKRKSQAINSSQTPSTFSTPKNSERGTLSKKKRQLETHSNDSQRGRTPSKAIPSTSTSTPSRKRYYDPLSVLELEYSSPSASSQASSVGKRRKRLFSEKIEKSPPQPPRKARKSAPPNLTRASTGRVRSAVLDDYFELKIENERRFFQCRLCPSKTLQLSKARGHRALHEDNLGVACSVCGCFVHRKRIKTHRTLNCASSSAPSPPSSAPSPSTPAASKNLRIKTHRTLNCASSSAPSPSSSAPSPSTPAASNNLQDSPSKLPRLYIRQCVDCGFHSKSRSFAEIHRQLHESGEGVYCTESGCGWLLKADSLSSHKKSYHSNKERCSSTEERKSKCEMCFPEGTPFYCDHCPCFYPDVVHFINHFAQSHKKEVELIDCGLCEEQWESLQLLQLHVKSSHPEEANLEEEEEVQMTCQHCGEIFPSKLKCDFHIAKQHADLILSCEECSKTFPSFWYYKKHNSTFHDGSPSKQAPARVTCDICQVPCQNNMHLVNHRNLAHAEEFGKRNKAVFVKEGYQDHEPQGKKKRTSPRKVNLEKEKRGKEADGDGSPATRTRRNGRMGNGVNED